MKKEYYEELKDKENVLSQVDILGSFDFLTCIVSLDSLDLDDLKVINESAKINTLEINSKLRKVLPLSIHEYTHFIDATSTLWGINHLHLLNEAYLTNEQYNHNETLFYKAKRFYNHIRKIKYPNYYNTIGQIQNPKKWIAMPTIGKLFNQDGELSKDSIVFMRFRTTNGDEIARKPISAVSILEASAMASELFSKIEILNKLADESEKIIENIELNKEVISFLYNKELTEYSACVHMVANHQQCKDILQAFFLVKLITNIVLNTSSEIFSTIVENNKFKEIFKLNETDEEYKRLKEGLEYNNIGVLYYLLVYGLPKDSYINPQSALLGIDKSLKKLGLCIETIKESANIEFNIKSSDIMETRIEPIKLLVRSAIENYNYIDIKTPFLPFNKLNLPKVILGDFDEDGNIAESLIFKNVNNSLAELNLTQCFEELSSGEKWVNRFSESCI